MNFCVAAGKFDLWYRSKKLYTFVYMPKITLDESLDVGTI